MSLMKSKLVMACLKKQDLQRKYDILKEESETIKTELQGLREDPEVHDFIVSLLGAGPRLSEETQRSLEHPMKMISEDGTERVAQVDVSSKYFDPETDEWEIVGIEENEQHQYRIQVEAVKNRGYMGAFAYTLDTFWTPWFNLVDKNENKETENSEETVSGNMEA